jgi:ABC-type bacteriocin/lantibiotic exporter with double-glycine peptidase domain
LCFSSTLLIGIYFSMTSLVSDIFQRSLKIMPTRRPIKENALSLFLRDSRKAFVGVAALSAVSNILALTGSLYMLQVYDRVITSRSVPTLVGLTILMVGLYSAYGVIDLLRGRVVRGLAIRLERRLREPVFNSVMALPNGQTEPRLALQPVKDLDQIRTFLGGNGPITLTDMPWLPVYMFLVFLLHPYLGLAAVVGAGVLICFALLTEFHSRGPSEASMMASATRQSFLDAARRNVEIIHVLGMGKRMSDRWAVYNEELLDTQRRANEVTGKLGSASRVFRMVLRGDGWRDDRLLGDDRACSCPHRRRHLELAQLHRCAARLCPPDRHAGQSAAQDRPAAPAASEGVGDRGGSSCHPARRRTSHPLRHQLLAEGR